MENQEEDHAAAAAVETEKEYPVEFECCVCLDLLHKPVVLGCGHISCFWCVFNAMDSWQESHCPVCRHAYRHFPSICQLLHFLLLKLYPIAYKRREQQVLEEEKRLELFSPQLENCFSASVLNKDLNTHRGVSPNYTTSSCTKVSLGSCPTVEGEPSMMKVSSENTFVLHKDDETSILGDIVNINVTSEQNSLVGDKFIKQENSKQVLITDLLCAICKEMLYRPVVLNCGHVYCEACIVSPGDKVPRCQVCQSVHPNGYPRVCWVLQNFLEDQFSAQYALKKEALNKQADIQNGSPPTCSTQAQKNAAQLSSIPTNRYLSWRSGQGPKVHFEFGCDYCGMCPIIGERYRCKDCQEKIGFDLCEGCYKSSSKLPGRFNQQHTSDHRLEIMQPNDQQHTSDHRLEIMQLNDRMVNLVLMTWAAESELVHSDAAESERDNSDAAEDARIMSADSPQDHLDIPMSLDNTVEDQEDTHPPI